MTADNVQKPDLRDVIPVFPVSGALLLPRGVLPLNIFEERYLSMVRDAMKGGGLIGMVQPLRDGAQKDNPGLYRTGCVGAIREAEETDKGTLMIALEGLARFRIVEELETITPYRQVRVDYDEYPEDLTDGTALPPGERDRFLTVLGRYLEVMGLAVDRDACESLYDERLIHSLAMTLPFSAPEKQALLENASLAERTRALITLMNFALADADGNDPVPKH